MQDGCLQVMDVDRTLSGVESQVIRSAHVGTRLRAAAGEPHRERVDVVVATDAGGFLGLGDRCATEFATPDDECVVQ